MHIVQGLIIADRSIGYILDGSKTWEMRSGPTQVRGAIALIHEGKGVVSGVATLANVGWALTPSEMLETRHLHKIPTEMIRSGEVAKWNTPWILTDIRRLPTPVLFDYPSGAINFVNLPAHVSREIAAQLEEAVDTTPPAPASI